MCYAKYVNFIEFLMDFGIFDDILDTIDRLITDNKLLHFKLSQLGQILSLNTGGFLRTISNTGYHSLQSQFLSTAISMVRYVATEYFVGVKAVATYYPPQYKYVGKP